MITEQNIIQFESFLKSQSIKQELIDALSKIARRTGGLPTPKSLRSSLNHVGLGVFDEWTLGYIITQYSRLFPSNLYRVPIPRKKKLVFNPYWQGRG